MKILIATPHAEPAISVKFVVSLFQMKKPFPHAFVFSSFKPLDKARNTLVENAKEYKADHIFFIDSDMLFPPETLTKLLEHKKDIVGGLYFQKLPNFLPVIYKRKGNIFEHILDYPKDTLYEIDGIGMGCLLIDMKVFDKIPKPYFKWDEPLSEDLYFCDKAKKYGFKIFVDTSLKGLHLSEQAISERHFEQARKLLQER